MVVYWRTVWPAWPIHILPSCSIQNWGTMLDTSPWSILSSYSCILRYCKNWIAVCIWGTSVAVGRSQPRRSEAGQHSSVYFARRLSLWTTFNTWPGMNKWIYLTVCIILLTVASFSLLTFFVASVGYTARSNVLLFYAVFNLAVHRIDYCVCVSSISCWFAKDRRCEIFT